MTMNPEIKARWVAALRSGDYKQGSEQLATPTREGTEYCCLGVLCELTVVDGAIPPPLRKGEAYVYEEQVSFLPPKVAAWAGIEGENGNPEVCYLGCDYPLADLNDNGPDDADRLSFDEIADLIEEQL